MGQTFSTVSTWRYNHIFSNLRNTDIGTEIITSIQVIKHFTKDDRLRIHRFHHDHIDLPLNECIAHDDYKNRNLIEHEILKITLRSGETFAVDLSCPQYGEKSTMCEWSDYVSRRVMQPYGTWNGDTQSGGNMIHVNDYSVAAVDRLKKARKREDKTMWAVLEDITLNFLEWQQNKDVPLRNLWTMSQHDFLQHQSNLFEFTEKKMRHHWKFQGLSGKYGKTA